MTDQPISQNLNPDPAASGGGDPKPAVEPKATASWLDGLNLADDLRQNPVVAKFADSPEGMVRSLIHLQGHYGVPAEQLVRLPKPDDAEGNAKLWNTLGRPETPDKYGIKAPEGSDVDQAALDGFLAHMHKAGPMTAPMAKAAADWYVNYAKQQGDAAELAFKQQREVAQGELRKDWGAAHDANMDAAAEMAARFGGDDYAKYLKESGLGDDPRTLKAWAAVAKAMGEPGAPDPGGAGGGRKDGSKTPAEAEAALTAYSTPDTPEYKALYDANHPQHDFHWAERNRLFALKRGEPAKK